MLLTISKDKTIHDLQLEFSSQYPFLKLEFYKANDRGPFVHVKKHLSHSISLRVAGMKSEGTIEVKDEMRVAELEHAFMDKFGLDMQVSRKSGIVWLETTMTDNWSLGKQNDHGREISITSRNLTIDEADNENN